MAKRGRLKPEDNILRTLYRSVFNQLRRNWTAKQSNWVKKTQNKGYYPAQGQSRSSRSVSINQAASKVHAGPVCVKLPIVFLKNTSSCILNGLQLLKLAIINAMQLCHGLASFSCVNVDWTGRRPTSEAANTRTRVHP